MTTTDPQCDVEAMTDSVRRYTLERIAPRIDAWDEAGGETEGQGPGGISMILVPGDAADLSHTSLDKMGWVFRHRPLRMGNVWMPARYLLGEEGAGLRRRSAVGVGAEEIMKDLAARQ